MIITLARARDQILPGLNNRSQWGCHCLLFWCVHCDEAENVPRSLTYTLQRVYCSAPRLPCHPQHTTRSGRKMKKKKECDKRKLSQPRVDVIAPKIRQWERLLERETASEWKAWQRLSHPAATAKTTFETSAKWKRQKYRRALITMRKKAEGRGANKPESSFLIVLSYFDVSLVYMVFFYHLWLLVHTWWHRIRFVNGEASGRGVAFERDMLI